MPDLSGIPAVDVALGLAFLYFLLSIVSSSINEAIAVAFKLRARTLEHGILSLVGNENVDSFFEHWRVQALMRPTRDPAKSPKPSYLPARIFSLTVIEKALDASESGKHVSHEKLLSEAEASLAKSEAQPPPAGKGLPPKPGKFVINTNVAGMLRDAVAEGQYDAASFRRAIERSFDEVMDRASGWYKRRAQIIVFVIAIALAALVNADSVAIGQRLWKDDALRAAVVAQASKPNAQACASAAGATTGADQAAKCLDKIDQLQLPIGWKDRPHTVQGFLSKIIGILITAFALTLGAPFWFDLLGKVARLRGSGPPTPGHEEKVPSPDTPKVTATATARS